MAAGMAARKARSRTSDHRSTTGSLRAPVFEEMLTEEISQLSLDHPGANGVDAEQGAISSHALPVTFAKSAELASGLRFRGLIIPKRRLRSGNTF